MVIYHYKVITPQGEVKEGSEPAETYIEMLSRLRERNYYPVTIDELVENDSRALPVLKKTDYKQISLFCRQLAAMLNAGVTIVKCLDILRQQITNSRLRKATRDMYENVQKGLVFSEALMRHPAIFPELMIHMVQIGETSGILNKIMLRLAIHYEKVSNINNRIKSAMVYPVILSLVCVAAVILLLTFVMPTFIGVFEGSGITLPTPTRILLAISYAVRRYWYVFLAAVLFLVYFIHKFKSSPSGRLYIDKWKLQAPIYKVFNQKVISSRFTRTLSTMLMSGIPLVQALDKVSGTVGNTVVKQDILKAREDIEKGASMSVTIRKLKHFPPMISSMIEIGEESGTLDEVLDKSANIYDEEVETELRRLMSLLEPAMILLMAGIVGFIVISMMLLMYTMLKTI